jgi:hypothetical protein
MVNFCKHIHSKFAVSTYIVSLRERGFKILSISDLNPLYGHKSLLHTRVALSCNGPPRDRAEGALDACLQAVVDAIEDQPEGPMRRMETLDESWHKSDDDSKVIKSSMFSL